MPSIATCRHGLTRERNGVPAILAPSTDERHNAMTNMRRLLELKQSVWLDYLSRGMTRSGEPEG